MPCNVKGLGSMASTTAPAVGSTVCYPKTGALCLRSDGPEQAGHEGPQALIPEEPPFPGNWRRTP